LRRDCNLHRGLGSAQATSAAAEVCCSIEPTSSPRPHIARDRAIKLLNAQKLFTSKARAATFRHHAVTNPMLMALQSLALLQSTLPKRLSSNSTSKTEC
jgi:hypothetical protein